MQVQYFCGSQISLLQKILEIECHAVTITACPNTGGNDGNIWHKRLHDEFGRNIAQFSQVFLSPLHRNRSLCQERLQQAC
jgi:hypothetical protein